MSVASKQDVVVKSSETPEAVERPLPSAMSLHPLQEMERLMERIMPRGWIRPFRWDWPLGGELVGTMDVRIPSVDMIDEDMAFRVRVELPGIDRKDIDVTASEDTLVIKTRAHGERKTERGDYFMSEISQSAAARSIHLPGSIDPGQVKATLKDGILDVVLPKADGSKRRHQVAVE